MPLLDKRHIAELAITAMDYSCKSYEQRVDWLLAYEAAMRKDEREACAKICDAMAAIISDGAVTPLNLAARDIRSRSNVGIEPPRSGRLE